MRNAGKDLAGVHQQANLQKKEALLSAHPSTVPLILGKGPGSSTHASVLPQLLKRSASPASVVGLRSIRRASRFSGLAAHALKGTKDAPGARWSVRTSNAYIYYTSP